MNEQFHDLKVETLEGGTVRLEQCDNCGESVIIDLHPAQVIYIAKSLVTSKPAISQLEAAQMVARIATLERRLLWLCDRFAGCSAALPHDFYERCADSLEFGAWLDASVTVATEFCADLVCNLPDDPSSQGKSA